MANEQAMVSGRRGNRWRIVGWTIPVILLLLPFVAMRFTEEVNWTASDFIFAALLFGTVGLAFEFIARRSSGFSYRAGAALAVIAAFLTIWVNAAVGMIGDDNVYNLVFGGVVFIALIGAILARFEPAGMARAMVVTALAQLLASAGGLTTDVRGAVLSMAFAAPWLLAAALFRNAGREA